ncbi:MAG: hypothetical protein ACRDHN_19805, partial [Thermomicrobiales bacterium]
MAGQWRSALWPNDPARRFLHLLLLLYLFKQILTAFIMPPFSGHDEVAHFQYIRIVAEDHRLPKLVDIEQWRDERTSSNAMVAG